MGRAAHAILVWRLEKGERIGILDILAGSTSLTSTVTSQLKLRVLSFFGSALIVIWALSPVGGQASFRQMTIGTQTFIEPASFIYTVPNGNLAKFMGSDQVTNYAIANSLFISAVILPIATKISPVDTWGNAKIPMIEHYENISTADDQGWFTADTSHNIYPSLIGLPMAGTNESFVFHVRNIETSYLHLDCPIVYGDPISVSNWPDDSYTGYGAVMWTTDNGTSGVAPRQFFYLSYGPTATSRCTVTTSYVEVEITCSPPASCAVSRLRRSQRAHLPAAHTVLDLHLAWDTFSQAFVNSLPGHPLFPTTVQNYLIMPGDPTQSIEAIIATMNDGPRVSRGDFAVRLGQLMNAYWTCLDAMSAITVGVNSNTTYMDGSDDFHRKTLPHSAPTNGTKSTSTPVIQCHLGWVVISCIASMVTIIASLIRPAVRYLLSRAPDVMLNISSLVTSTNPYIALPTNGTFMDASDRARLLKDFKVRFGDFEADANVGKLVIGSIYPRGQYAISNIRKGRLYE